MNTNQNDLCIRVFDIKTRKHSHTSIATVDYDHAHKWAMARLEADDYIESIKLAGKFLLDPDYVRVVKGDKWVLFGAYERDMAKLEAKYNDCRTEYNNLLAAIEGASKNHRTSAHLTDFPDAPE